MADPTALDCDGDGGRSWSGVDGHDVWTGEGERRAGKAERKLFDGRLVGIGACVWIPRWSRECNAGKEEARGEKRKVMNTLEANNRIKQKDRPAPGADDVVY